MENYHTHTLYCNHAENTVDEMTLHAIAEGFKKLGFSEHIFLPVNHNRKRLKPEELELYIADVESAKIKYKGQIEILLGFEVEYSKEFEPFIKNLLSDKRIDYIIFGNHKLGDIVNNDGLAYDECENLSDIQQFYTRLEQGMTSELFLFVAHPDAVFMHYKEWNIGCEKIINEFLDAVEKNDIPLGFNANGFQKNWGYPDKNFWELVRERKNIKIVIEMDAHKTKTLTSELYEALKKQLIDWKLDDKLIETVDIAKYRKKTFKIIEGK